MRTSSRGSALRLQRSLRLRVTLATALAFVGLGVTVCLVLPRAYTEQLRESLRERTRVMTLGVALLLRHETIGGDSAAAEHLDHLAGWLDAEPDFECVVLLDGQGRVRSAWPKVPDAWPQEELPVGAAVREGADHFVGVVPAPGLPDAAAVAVLTSTARLRSDLDSMRWLFVSLFLLTCVAFWILSRYIVRGVLDPLEGIRKAAMGLADGEPIVNIPRSGDREIDELGSYIAALGEKRRQSTLMTNPLLTYLRDRSPVRAGGRREGRGGAAGTGGEP